MCKVLTLWCVSGTCITAEKNKKIQKLYSLGIELWWLVKMVGWETAACNSHIWIRVGLKIGWNYVVCWSVNAI